MKSLSFNLFFVVLYMNDDEKYYHLLFNPNSMCNYHTRTYKILSIWYFKIVQYISIQGLYYDPIW